MPRGRRGPFRENGVRRPLWRRRSRAEPRRRAAPRVRGRGGGRRGHAQDAGRRLLEGGDAGSREERRPPHGLLATRRAPRGAEEPAALPWGHHGLRAVAADQGSHGDASLEAHEGGKRDRAARDVQRLAPRGAGLADGKRHFCAASGDGSRRRRSQRRVLRSARIKVRGARAVDAMPARWRGGGSRTARLGAPDALVDLRTGPTTWPSTRSRSRGGFPKCSVSSKRWNLPPSSRPR